MSSSTSLGIRLGSSTSLVRQLGLDVLAGCVLECGSCSICLIKAVVLDMVSKFGGGGGCGRTIVKLTVLFSSVLCAIDPPTTPFYHLG